jgi:hypothetical protein
MPAVDEILHRAQPRAATFDGDTATRHCDFWSYSSGAPGCRPMALGGAPFCDWSTTRAAYLERVPLDPRSRQTDAHGFSTATLIVAVRRSSAGAPRTGVPCWFVMEGLRGYLVAQLAVPRCSDSVTKR